MMGCTTSRCSKYIPPSCTMYLYKMVLRLSYYKNKLLINSENLWRYPTSNNIKYSATFKFLCKNNQNFSLVFKFVLSLINSKNTTVKSGSNMNFFYQCIFDLSALFHISAYLGTMKFPWYKGCGQKSWNPGLNPHWNLGCFPVCFAQLHLNLHMKSLCGAHL